MPLRRLTRRWLAPASAAVLLAASLSSCGFDLATDRVNTIAAGTNDRDAVVKVLGAVVVSAEEGSGTFIASFVNDSTEEPATVEAVEAGSGSDVQVLDFAPIELEPTTLVNLAEDEQGVAVEGDFGAGGNVPMVVRLSGGEVVELSVPVVPNCNEFAGLDGTGGDCEVAEPVGDHG